MSTGQFAEDVRLAVNGRTRVDWYGRFGGNFATVEEILDLLETSAASRANEFAPYA
jgi:2-oxoglutarate ferredoxin oxidoreductase subunit alpha